MDDGRFDSLTRSLATAKTRRGLLGGLAALGAGLLGARSAGAQVTQAQCGNRVCAGNPGVCTNGCVCCVYGNGNSRCRPPGECTGTVLCPPGQSPISVLNPAFGCAPTTTTAAPTTTTTATPTTTTTAAPTCAGRAVQIVPGPPTQAVFTVQVVDPGLASIVVTRSENADTVVPPFTVGTTDPVVATSTKIDQSQTARVEFIVTDLDGTVQFCDVTF